MDSILVIGADSIVGRAVAEQLAVRANVSAVWFHQPVYPEGCTGSPADEATIIEKCAGSDVVIFCGGGAVSSWDAEFGDLSAEEAWLQCCLAAVRGTETDFVFVSSDAVFGGPWVFHDDDSNSFADDSIATRLRTFEARVSELHRSLIVRTNVAGPDEAGRGFAARILQCIENGECEHVIADSYATPIGALEFAEILAECLAARIQGMINIAGSERTTPFRFATMLAAAVGCSIEHLMPLKSEPGRITEHSLRCDRLRQELKISTPLLNDTVDQVADLFRMRSRRTAAA